MNCAFTAGRRGVRGCERKRDVQAERSGDRGSGRRRGAVGRPGRTPPGTLGIRRDARSKALGLAGPRVRRLQQRTRSPASSARVSRFGANSDARFRCATRSGCRSEDRRSRRPALLRQQRRAVPLRCAQRVPVYDRHRGPESRGWEDPEQRNGSGLSATPGGGQHRAPGE